MNNQDSSPEALLRSRIRKLSTFGEHEWWKRPVPPMAGLVFLRDGTFLMPKGQTGMMWGAPGAGKSRLVNQLCIAVATGRPFLGNLQVPDPGKVLYLYTEDDEAETMRRWSADMTALGITGDPEAERLLDQNCEAVFLGDRDWRLHIKDRPTDKFAALLSWIKKNGPYCLVVLDTLTHFAGSDAEESSSVANDYGKLKRELARLGPFVLSIHHPPKGDDETYRGSSGFGGSFRWLAHLKVLEERPGQGNRLVLKLP